MTILNKVITFNLLLYVFSKNSISYAQGNKDNKEYNYLIPLITLVKMKLIQT